MTTNLSYARYPTRPRIIDLNKTPEALEFQSDGNVYFRPTGEHELVERSAIIIPKENIFDILMPTMSGLLDDLTPGSELMEKFLTEWSLFQNFLNESADYRLYGLWVYYPLRNHLIHSAPRFWHHLALIVRNSLLLTNPSMNLPWEGMRTIFEKSVIALAGASVGNNIIVNAAMLTRPLHIKVADSKDYQVNNANRVRLTYADFGRNKALVTAEQLHAVDPFFDISVYSEGIHPDNINDFVSGNENREEPTATLIIEETDDPDVKILLREKARERGLPVVMVTDIGSVEQIDIRRFDVNRTLPLTYGVPDKELYKKRDIWQKDLADREKFFEFAFAMSGTEQLSVPEFKRIIFREIPVPFAGIPQLGSTAAAAGGIAADVITKILLGHKTPERIFIDYAKGKILVK